MKKNNVFKLVIIFLVLVLFCILVYLVYLMMTISSNNYNKSAEIVSDEANTVLGVLEKYNCIFVRDIDNTIYVVFPKDLFDDLGNSNEDYFISITKDLEDFFERDDFSLVDEEKNINIYAKYDRTSDKHIISINSLENYYSMVNGRDYVDVENVNYSKQSDTINPICTILTNLKSNGMRLSSIEDIVGEGKQLDDGYISFLDGKIKMKIANKKIVYNIIISRDYDENIFENFENDDSLDYIYSNNPDNCFGSVEEGYLGYRTDDLYYFIYEDEVVVYAYSYVDNINFEKALKKYFQNKDLENFIMLITGQVKVYDLKEYDLDAGIAVVDLSCYGIEINISENDSRGITLYNNYCFTENSRQFVKDGLVTFKNYENSIEKLEKERVKKVGVKNEKK